MADAVVALFGIALFCIALYAAVRLYVGWRRRANQWQIEETSTPISGIRIYLTRGSDRIQIQAQDPESTQCFDRVDSRDRDWDVKVRMLREEAKYRQDTLNGQ